MQLMGGIDMIYPAILEQQKPTQCPRSQVCDFDQKQAWFPAFLQFGNTQKCFALTSCCLEQYSLTVSMESIDISMEPVL